MSLGKQSCTADVCNLQIQRLPISTITLCSCKHVDFYQKGIRNRHIVIQLKDRENEISKRLQHSLYLHRVVAQKGDNQYYSCKMLLKNQEKA